MAEKKIDAQTELDEQKYVDELVNKVSAAQKILQLIPRNRLTKFSGELH